jgi:tripartite-type tricarboxylate transporter receptor subunit TctC
VAAMEALARAAPDGQTLCYSAISPLVYAPLLAKPGYDPQRDFQPVMAVMHTPVLLLAHAGFKPDSLAEVIAAARAAPGRVRWASSGLATVGHLVQAQIAAAAGVEITHVPYKGGGQQLNDALSGQFEMLSSNVAAQQLQYLKQGRLKAIAVGAPQRLAVLPEVPTLAELGQPQANLVSTFGIFAPRGTPPARVQWLNRLLNDLLSQPEMRERLAASSNLPGGGSPEDFALQIELERERSRGLMLPLQARP